MKKLLFLFLSIHALCAFAQIERNNQSALTIEQIMQDPAQWIGTSPTGVEWSDNSDKIYFDWNPEKDTLASLYAYSLKGKKIEKVSPEEKEVCPAVR